MAPRVNEELNDRSGMLGNLLNIGGIKLEQRDYPGALESALQARELAGQIGDTLRLSVCLSNIGVVHSRR